MHPETVFDQIQQFRARSGELASYLKVVGQIDETFPSPQQKQLLSLGREVLVQVCGTSQEEPQSESLAGRLALARTTIVGAHDGVLPQVWRQLVDLCDQSLALKKAVSGWSVRA